MSPEKPLAVRLIEVEIPAEEGAPVPAGVKAWTDLDAEYHREVLGHEDLVARPEELLPGLRDQRYHRKVLLAAVAAGSGGDQPTDPEEVLGVGCLRMPVTDNQHLAEIELVVRKAHRRAGIGTALWQAMVERARPAGRDTILGWTAHGGEPAEGEPRLVPATGSGAIPEGDPTVAFAQHHGFTLEQVERQSTLRLPVAGEALAAWRGEAEAKAGPDYRLVQWQDRTPEDRLEAMAELYRRMSTDIPSGAIELEEESWDAERVRTNDERTAAAGRRYVLSAVEHVPTGRLVAFTVIHIPQGRAGAYQEDTLVHGDHRGKRLGLWVKAANLELLAHEHPQVERIHTWNADENAHMLAINVRMGFRVAAVEGAWQARL